MTARRLVCTSCSIVSSESLCSKCNRAVTSPNAFDCAKLGLLPELQELVEQKDSNFDVNTRDEKTKATVLHYAAISGKMGVLEFLLGNDTIRAQVNVDALDGESHTTALFWAACYNQIYAIELLLRHGADPNFRDRLGFTPFLAAIRRCFPITAAYLVAKGSDVNQRMQDASQKTALMLQCQPEHFHLDTFRMVLSLQAAVNAQDADGNTALHHAAKNNVAMAIRMLLDAKADTRIQNHKGLTAWKIAQLTLDPKSSAFHLLQEDQELEQLATWTSIPKQTFEAHLYKFSFVVPWIVFPLSSYLIVALNGWPVILLALFSLLMVALVVLKILQRGSYGDKRKAACFMFGINVASICYLVASFPRFSAYCSSTFCLLTALSFGMMGITLYKTCTSDPGQVFTLYDEKLHNIRTLVESKLPSPTKLCLTCLHKRPLRGKHCAELNACIAKFDHYCPFVLNAIGAQNHAMFLGFLFAAVLSIGLELIACYRFARAQPELPADWTLPWLWLWNIPSHFTAFSGFLTWLWSLAHFQPLLFCVMFLDLVHVVWITYMLLLHVYLLCAALTTNELIKKENPNRVYSRGLVSNIIDFFGLPGHRPVDWRRVYTLEDFKHQVNNNASSQTTRKDV